MNNLIIDIDGTLCPIKKSTEEYKDLVPYTEMINKIKEYKEKGFNIILFTSRNMRTYKGDINKILKYTKPVLEEWLDKWNIPYDDLIFGKPWPGKEGFYIDDRSIRPLEFLNNNLDELNKICECDKKILNTYEYIFKINEVNIKVKSNNVKVIKELINKYGAFYETGTEPVTFTINYMIGQNFEVGYKFKEKEQKEYSYINKIDNSLNVYMKNFDNIDINFIKRMFTTTLTKVLQENGYIILHGACVSKNGEGIIISGNKRAGKTTTLLNLLSRGYDYTCNDRVAVKQENGEFIAIGIPFSMGIISRDAKKLFNVDKFNIGFDKEEEKVYLENNQIESTLNVNVNSKVKLKSIIVPKYNENIKNIAPKRIENVVDLLGPYNIMTDNSIPEDKEFLNKMFNIDYYNSLILNGLSSYYIEQSSTTFDELDSYIKNNILKKEKQNVLRPTYPLK